MANLVEDESGLNYKIVKILTNLTTTATKIQRKMKLEFCANSFQVSVMINWSFAD